MFNPDIPWYPEGKPAHIAGFTMDSNPHKSSFLETTKSGDLAESLMYNPKYTQVEGRKEKGVLKFNGYVGRKPMQSAARRRGNRDLDTSLTPNYFPDARHQRTISFDKQTDRSSGAKRGRNLCPVRQRQYKDEVTLRPKYNALDKKADKVVPFSRGIAREQTTSAVNQSRTTGTTANVREVSDIHQTVVKTKPRVKGYVSMATQSSRYDRPASRFAIAEENEGTKRTMYYSPADKFALNNFRLQQEQAYQNAFNEVYDQQEFDEEEEEDMPTGSTNLNDDYY